MTEEDLMTPEDRRDGITSIDDYPEEERFSLEDEGFPGYEITSDGKVWSINSRKWLRPDAKGTVKISLKKHGHPLCINRELFERVGLPALKADGVQIKPDAFGGKFLVCDTGDIINPETGNTLKGNNQHDGYVRIGMYGKHMLQHKVVLTTFKGADPDPKKNQIDHLNGDPVDNCLENLEWVTGKENCIRARDNGQKPKTCKLNYEIAQEIRARKAKHPEATQSQLALLYGCSSSNIGMILANKCWTR